MDTRQLRDLDRSVLWHPFTQQQGWQEEDAPIIERGDGVLLWDTDGRSYIDGTSSLWCNVHGHRHPRIDAAIREQLDRVAHSTMLGLGHPLAITLAERLLRIVPRPGPGILGPELTRVFYSDNGSTAGEIAIKMAFQYQRQRGEPQRTGFVGLRDAYHGDTLGSVSLGGMDLFHEQYRPLLFDSWKVEPGDAGELESLLASHGDRIAAVMIEPLVQGAAGMLMHPPGYLRRVRELCDEHGVLMICDEVATGFGRTGRMFACEHEGVVPDLLCVAKGITGGYLPLAATFATEAIYDGFLGAYEDYRTFFHGHTYTGNPLACAAAHATLDVFEEERTLERLDGSIALLASLLDELIAPLPAVQEIRRVGFMTGIQLTPFGPARRMGHQVTLAARERGAMIRPLGDVVVVMPPLSIGDGPLRRLVEITAEAIRVATDGIAPVDAGAPSLSATGVS